MPSLSVIVLNSNGKHLLSDCLSSLCSQRPPDIEILMSITDRPTVTWNTCEGIFLAFELLRWNEIRGIDASSAPFITLFNNDAVADQYWAENLLTAATDPHVGIVASKVLLFANRSQLDSAGDGMTTVGVA